MNYNNLRKIRKKLICIFIVCCLFLGCTTVGNNQEIFVQEQIENNTTSSINSTEITTSFSESASFSSKITPSAVESILSSSETPSKSPDKSTKTNEEKKMPSTTVSSSKTSEPPILETSSEPNNSSSKPQPSKQITWGKTTDILKTYTDHDGANHYEAYEITGNLGLNDRYTQRVKVKWPDIGSQYLSGIQKLKPLSKHPDPPANLVFSQLYIVDNMETFQYDFYENGMIFTIQNGKRYYLGEDYNTLSKIMSVTSALLAKIEPQQEKSKSLLNLLTTPLQTRSIKDDDIEKLTRSYLPDQYNIAIALNSYGQLRTPIIIHDAETKTKLFDVLDGSWNYSEQELITGGEGSFIQVYNDNEYECFQILGKKLKNNQISNDNAFLELPNKFTGTLYLAISRELASRY